MSEINWSDRDAQIQEKGLEWLKAIQLSQERAEAAEVRVAQLEDEIERLREELRHYAGPKVEKNVRHATEVRR